MKDANEYYQGARADIVAMVPPECRRILDVGCGFGGLGRLLQARSECEVFGVELNPEAETHLRQTYQRFWIGDVESTVLSVDPEYFDCVVFADVLEHLVDPWKTLKRYSAYVRNGGYVVASIPNVRNLSILFNLVLKGRWHYEDSGLLDRGHLRFFTRTEIVNLFAQAGLTIESIRGNQDKYSFWKRLAVVVPMALIPDLSVCQFLVRARRQ
ncbi:MAG: class I SAM-dependent methyltransferase [Sulfuricaulis sp.]